MKFKRVGNRLHTSHRILRPLKTTKDGLNMWLDVGSMDGVSSTLFRIVFHVGFQFWRFLLPPSSTLTSKPFHCVLVVEDLVQSELVWLENLG